MPCKWTLASRNKPNKSLPPPAPNLSKPKVQICREHIPQIDRRASALLLIIGLENIKGNTHPSSGARTALIPPSPAPPPPWPPLGLRRKSLT